jgi:hypothetical protein
MAVVVATAQCTGDHCRTDDGCAGIQWGEVARGGLGGFRSAAAGHEDGAAATAIVVVPLLIMLMGTAASHAGNSGCRGLVPVLVCLRLALGEGMTDQANQSDGCDELAHGCSEVRAGMAND